MQKSKIRPINVGKQIRMSYASTDEIFEIPNLIEVQKDSYNWFLKEGLKRSIPRHFTNYRFQW